MRFERHDGEKNYGLVCVKDSQTVTLKGQFDIEFDVNMQTLLQNYRPILEEGELWPEDLPRVD
ncbi:hypothetical protein [Acidithiobacillus thiooxidans]|uniref:Uncharacterized protein n=1 Tax=Acidithiobacillus thiooxidans ATCC 19377 TaxID=637390 RepID=A0A543Q1T4_ACITH|nr:hypothetical protein [Acidithiobacillus thiooxidans]MDX5935560.1 hypothetical protein [Acidithiobacillus thiooxidans]TQN50297.1 hypothetical protein DLNHIDIE_00150 [Acidithiobacillus thiooxidans ATCC 19377]